jgi:hypothetical protein
MKALRGRIESRRFCGGSRTCGLHQGLFGIGVK